MGVMYIPEARQPDKVIFSVMELLIDNLVNASCMTNRFGFPVNNLQQMLIVSIEVQRVQ